MASPDSAGLRRRMVDTQLAPRGIGDTRVLEAMARAPREAFVPPEMRAHAYDDGALPIGNGQTISQPYIVALMTQALALQGGERILDVGTGSGYGAAVLAEIAGEVVSIERDRELAECARARLQEQGYANVTVIAGDGSLGWPEKAPYDGIVVAAGAPTVPTTLSEQIKSGGILILPVGDTRTLQRLERCRKLESGELDCAPIADVRFVPLVGDGGWQTEGAL